MIQYRITGLSLSAGAAATCDHPALADLRRHGPWVVSAEVDGTLILTQQVSGWTPSGWGAWEESATPGRTFRLAEPRPDLTLLRRRCLESMDPEPVTTADGLVLLIPPAIAAGVALRRDGSAGRPSTAYGRAFFALRDRIDRGEDPAPADWIACILLAIQVGHRLTDDAILAGGIFGTTDLAALMEAMHGVPKASDGGG